MAMIDAMHQARAAGKTTYTFQHNELPCSGVRTCLRLMCGKKTDFAFCSTKCANAAKRNPEHIKRTLSSVICHPEQVEIAVTEPEDANEAEIHHIDNLKNPLTQLDLDKLILKWHREYGTSRRLWFSPGRQTPLGYCCSNKLCERRTQDVPRPTQCRYCSQNPPQSENEMWW